MKRHSTPMFNLLLVVVLSVSVGVVPVLAQMRVGQPAGAPDKSAALDINGGPYTTGSQYRGLIPPKASLTKSTLATPITDPAVGLLIYNTAKTGDVTPGYYYWDGTKWLRFNTIAPNGARLGADGDYVPGYTLAGLRALTSALNNIILVEPGQEGLFRIESSSAADDGGTLLITAGGQRYRRVTLDNRITPQMFGAKGDSLTDDGVALQNWLNVSGNYEHYFPAGKYRTTVRLVRENKGAVSLIGAGSGLTKIYVSGNTGGISIDNSLNGQYGDILVSGFEVMSVGTKSGITEAIYIRSQTRRPGPFLTDVTVKCTTVGQEFTTGLHFEDCLGVTMNGIDVQAASLLVTTGIVINNSSTRQSFEHNFNNVGLRTLKTGVDVYSSIPSSFGNEGLQFDNINIVGVGSYGIRAIAPGSPFLGFRGVHINAIGGECIHIEGYNQISFSTSDFYSDINKDTQALPARAIYLKSPIVVGGEFFAVLLDNTPVGVEIDGNGGALDLKVGGSYASATTDFIKVNSTFTDGSIFDVNAVWTGNQTWGATRTGKLVNDLSGTVVTRLLIPLPATNPTNILDPTLAFNPTGTRSVWDVIPKIRASTQRIGYIATTSTVDPSLVNGWSVDNGSVNVTVTIDRTKLYEGQVIFIRRYNSFSTGTITVRQSDGMFSVVGPDGQFTPSTIIPLTGSRAMYWIFSGGHLLHLSGTEAMNPNNNLSDVTSITTARENLGLGATTMATELKTNYFSALPNGYITTSTTVDPTVNNVWYVNSTEAVTLSIDQTKLRNGQIITVRRYNSTSNATITIQTVNSSVNKVVDPDGSFINSWNLPTISGQRQAHFRWDNGYLVFDGY